MLTPAATMFWAVARFRQVGAVACLLVCAPFCRCSCAALVCGAGRPLPFPSDMAPGAAGHGQRGPMSSAVTSIASAWWRQRCGDGLVLLSHHGNVLLDWSSSIWQSTCSGTTAGDLAQGYLDRIVSGRLCPYQPMWLQEGVTRSSAICLHHGTCRHLDFHATDNSGETLDG